MDTVWCEMGKEFKIPMLQCVCDLFKNTKNSCPLVCGFGNRITDAVSYRSVGISDARIFIVDTKGKEKEKAVDENLSTNDGNGNTQNFEGVTFFTDFNQISKRFRQIFAQ